MPAGPGSGTWPWPSTRTIVRLNQDVMQTGVPGFSKWIGTKKVALT